MATSLDDWLIDQVYYAIGSDLLIRQTIDPEYAEVGIIPSNGAWTLPIQSYLELPGVQDATRVGIYPASLQVGGHRGLNGTFLGIDRLDLPRILFFRPDFASEPLGSLMNRMAIRPDAVLISEHLMRERGYDIGGKISMRIVVVSVMQEEISTTTEFTIAGTYTYFPTVYERSDGQPVVIGNLDFVFDQIGRTMLHHIWLKIEPDADQRELMERVKDMGVFVARWEEAREEIAKERARTERVGIYGTLTIGFLGAALLSGIGLLIYNYASLQERLFRFTILRAVGLSVVQVVAQVAIEYIILMAYSVVGGAAIGVWASRLFIPFFQAADKNVLRPPTMIPLVAWQDIGRISGAFTVVLVLAQIIVISVALRRGIFQALRMGDRE
jgi:hypothetical protein